MIFGRSLWTSPIDQGDIIDECPLLSVTEYDLPRNKELGLEEMIVDFRQLHTIRLDILADLCMNGKRIARLQPLYREYLNRHFADSYSRIGLPEPYETE
ncbi:MAG: hypothetical protein FJ267_04805 [Planctomycetes bacterium]|nr:hypothetical protein [Planctomycetota bacterium]